MSTSLMVGDAWVIMWRSRNRYDGDVTHLISDQHPSVPDLFSTRVEAERYIRKHYGYIAHRADLRREPYNWRMPVAIRVTIAPAAVGNVDGDGTNQRGMTND